MRCSIRSHLGIEHENVGSDPLILVLSSSLKTIDNVSFTSRSNGALVQL